MHNKVKYYPILPICLGHCCLRISVAVRRHHDHSSSYKGKHFIEVVRFQRFSPLSPCREHGGILADMLLGYLLQATGNGLNVTLSEAQSLPTQ